MFTPFLGMRPFITGSLFPGKIKLILACLALILAQGCVDLPDPAAENAASGDTTTISGKGFPAITVRCVVKSWESRPESGLKPPPTPIASARVHAVKSPDFAGLTTANAQASAITSADGIATIDAIDPGKVYSIVIDRDGDGIGDHRTFPAMFAEPVKIEALVYPNSCTAQRWASAEPERSVVNHGDLLRINLFGYTQGSTHLSAVMVNGRTGAVLWESSPTQVGGNFEKESFIEIESAWSSTAAPSAPCYVIAARLSDDPASGWESMGGSPLVVTGTLVGSRGVTEPPSAAPAPGLGAVTPLTPGSPYRVSDSRVTLEITSPGAWFLTASNDAGFTGASSFRTDTLPGSTASRGDPDSPRPWLLDWDLSVGSGLRALKLWAGDKNGNLSEPAVISFLVGTTGEIAPAFTFGIPRYDYLTSSFHFAWTLDTPGGRCLLSLYAALPAIPGKSPGLEWPPRERLADLAGESIEIRSGEGSLTLEAQLPRGSYRLMASLFDPVTTASARVVGPAFEITAPKTPGSPPTVPEVVTPENKAENTPQSGTLSWSCSDPDGEELAFDLYLRRNDTAGLESSETGNAGGTIPASETPVATSLKQPSFAYGPLEAGSLWLWKVSATDGEGKTSVSPVFSFRVARPLSVTVSTPETGEIVNGDFMVRWKTEGGSIERTATVEFSRAGGQWIVLASGIRDSEEFLLNSRGLANGSAYQIRVRVSSPGPSAGAPTTAFDLSDGTFTVTN